MGPSQIVSSFPESVWDGLTASRRSPTTDAPPTKEDWNRLVSEVTALQEWVRTNVGWRPTFIMPGVSAGNYTNSGAFGSVDYGPANGHADFFVGATGPLNGDTAYTFVIQETDRNSISAVWTEITRFTMSTEDTTNIQTFIRTKRYVRIYLISTGSEIDGAAAGFFGAGTAPREIQVALRPQQVESAATSELVNFTKWVGGQFDDMLFAVHIGGTTDEGYLTTKVQEPDNTGGYVDVAGAVMTTVISEDSLSKINFRTTLGSHRTITTPSPGPGWACVLIGR